MYTYTSSAIGGTVVVRGAKYVVWGDGGVFLFSGTDTTRIISYFTNLLNFLLSCNPTTECDGYECGTGFCGGDCPNTCSSYEKCDINLCL